ncbi:AAA family ATPase [Kitasatospora saccharophila]|uniref:AAA family ATPase n=1 Tax=Kitasatospora saccharophila TaxID=407973 RepID=UPI003624D4E8
MVRPGAGRPQVFVGRQDEVAALLDAAGRARGGAGFALVGGEAGAGKSTLLERLRERLADGGWRVVTGRCPESAGRRRPGRGPRCCATWPGTSRPPPRTRCSPRCSPTRTRPVGRTPSPAGSGCTARSSPTCTPPPGRCRSPSCWTTCTPPTRRPGNCSANWPPTRPPPAAACWWWPRCARARANSRTCWPSWPAVRRCGCRSEGSPSLTPDG